jgi:hypothetical protein
MDPISNAPLVAIILAIIGYPILALKRLELLRERLRGQAITNPKDVIISFQEIQAEIVLGIQKEIIGLLTPNVEGTEESQRKATIGKALNEYDLWDVAHQRKQCLLYQPKQSETTKHLVKRL